MNIITIMNYDQSDSNRKLMCYIWLDRIIKHAPGANIFIYYEEHYPTITRSFKNNKMIVERRQRHGSGHHNLSFKLHNLCNTGLKEFLYLDVDMYVIHNLNKLWECRKDKPWIGVNHQWIPKHRDTHREPFLNSGLQLVSDSSFYNYNEIMKAYNNSSFRKIPGFDQCALFKYCNSINYDYTHSNVGYEWNSCAAVANVTHIGKNQWSGVTVDLEKNHQIYINHYWAEYKPWRINCPIHNYYKNLKVK